MFKSQSTVTKTDGLLLVQMVDCFVCGNKFTINLDHCTMCGLSMKTVTKQFMNQ